jgi:hypothetical protein
VIVKPAREVLIDVAVAAEVAVIVVVLWNWKLVTKIVFINLLSSLGVVMGCFVVGVLYMFWEAALDRYRINTLNFQVAATVFAVIITLAVSVSAAQ